MNIDQRAERCATSGSEPNAQLTSPTVEAEDPLEVQIARQKHDHCTGLSANQKHEHLEFRHLLRWPWDGYTLVFLMPFAFAAGLFALWPLRNWDYWWHLAVGRLIDAYDAVPAANHFLYTVAVDAPSFIQPWLAQWLAFQVHTSGDLILSLALRNALASFALGTVAYVAMRRSGRAYLGLILGALAMVVAFPYFTLGPDITVVPLFLILVWVAYTSLHKRVPWLAFLIFPLSSALWANLAESFLIPLFLSANWCAATVLRGLLRHDEKRWTQAWIWAGICLLCLGATGVNPRGFEILSFWLSQLRSPLVQEFENQWRLTTPYSPMIAGLVFYGILCALAANLWCVRARARIEDVILAIAFGLAALVHQGHLIWFGLLAPIVWAPYLGRALDRLPQAPVAFASRLNARLRGWKSGVLVIALIMSTLLIQPLFAWYPSVRGAISPVPARREPPHAGLVPEDTPVLAVNLLRKYVLPFSIFHHHKYAGFLIYKLQDIEPQPIAFLDPRTELAPRTIHELYALIHEERDFYRGIFQQYDVGAVVASATEQSALIEQLRDNREWEIIIDAGSYLVFLQSFQPHSAFPRIRD